MKNKYQRFLKHAHPKYRTHEEIAKALHEKFKDDDFLFDALDWALWANMYYAHGHVEEALEFLYLDVGDVRNDPRMNAILEKACDKVHYDYWRPISVAIDEAFSGK